MLTVNDVYEGIPLCGDFRDWETGKAHLFVNDVEVCLHTWSDALERSGIIFPPYIARYLTPHKECFLCQR